MKQFLIIAALLIISAGAYAQGSTGVHFTTTIGGTVKLDTNTDAAQNTMYSKFESPSNSLHSIEYVATKISGYAKGSAALYYTIDTTGLAAGTAIWFKNTDSLTFTDQTTNSKRWDVSDKLWRLAKVVTTTIDSTQSVQFKARYLAK